jgi:hypothetical protein
MAPSPKKGQLQRAAIATAAFKSPSASEMLSNPAPPTAVGRPDRGSVYASLHLIEQPMDAF